MRYAAPVLLLAALVALFAFGLRLDPTRVPSPLIGKPAPAFELPLIAGGSGTFGSAQLPGAPVLVNFWASWCPPCLQEHPVLLELARAGVRIVGVAYKDAPADSLAWLQRHGNPFAQVVSDLHGRVGLDWGVYGAPETYVLDAQGVIRYKHIGPLSRAEYQARIAPLLAAARP